MKRMLLLIVFITAICSFAKAQMTTRVIRDSLFIPWELVCGPDTNIWFTQKNGYVCRLEPTLGRIDTLYHDTNTVVQNEGGMLGLALDPNFTTQPYVYVAYNYMQASTYKERIVKYSYANNTLQNPQILLDNINASNIHNGCRLLITGDKLFITAGDASTGSVAQNINALNGKILRINLDGSIPADNPISGSTVWSWGHRNAQGLVYANNRLYSSEHGPNNDDEFNIIQKARNYGWPTVAGYCNSPLEMQFCTDSNVVEPIKAWTPTLAVCGIDYYDHPMFPGFQKSILMTTLKDQHLYELQLNSNYDSIATITQVSNVNFGRLRDICISPTGRIYLSTSNSNANGSTQTDKIIEIYDPSYVPPPMSIPAHSSHEAVNIFPNPATDHITIRTTEITGNCKYSILNMQGQIVAEGLLNRIQTDISIRDLAKGMYLVQLTYADHIIKRQIISRL